MRDDAFVGVGTTFQKRLRLDIGLVILQLSAGLGANELAIR